jgi:hypothetical protein
MDLVVSPKASGCSYIQELCRSEISSDVAASTEEVLFSTKCYCFTKQFPFKGIQSYNKLVLVIHSEEVDLLKDLISILTNPQSKIGPRIILLSSLMTWCGSRIFFDSMTMNVEEAFQKRSPLPGMHELYSIENRYMQLLQSQKLASFEFSCVGLGLLYGGGGYDMSDIFKSMWEYGMGTDEIKLHSLIKGATKVPMIHYKDLVTILKILLSSDTVPAFVPASDCCDKTLKELSIDMMMNTNQMSREESSKFITCCTQEEVLQSIVNANCIFPNTLLWSADMTVTNEYMTSKLGDTFIVENSLTNSMPNVWDEYLKAHQLSAVSAIVAGNPKSGKTSVAKAMVESFKCQYVTLPAAIMYVLKVTVTDGDSKLKEELYAIVEASLAEGKKAPKKGEEPEPTEVDPETLELTDALLDKISPELKRRALAFMIRKEPTCARKGYVMDIWETELLTEYAHFEEIFKTRVEVVEPVATEGEDEGNAEDGGGEEKKDPDVEEEKKEEGGGGGADGATAEGETFVNEESLWMLPDLFVELQCSDDASNQRLLTEVGFPDGDLKKAPKDVQAQVKSFGDAVSAYRAMMVDIPIPPKEDPITEGEAIVEATEESKDAAEGEKEATDDVAPPEFIVSHQLLIAIFEQKPEAQIKRINASEVSIEDCTKPAASALLGAHGKVGWLSQEEMDIIGFPVVIEETGTKEQISEEETAEVEEESKGNNASQEMTYISLMDEKLPIEIELENNPCTEDPKKEMLALLQEIQEDMRADIIGEANAYQTYLLNTVMVELSKGIVNIVENGPEDPILSLADHLWEAGEKLERDAETEAREKFDTELAEAEAAWSTPKE